MEWAGVGVATGGAPEENDETSGAQEERSRAKISRKDERRRREEDWGEGIGDKGLGSELRCVENDVPLMVDRL